MFIKSSSSSSQFKEHPPATNILLYISILIFPFEMYFEKYQKN